MAWTATFIGGLISLLFCLGLGWGPSASSLDPVPLALLGLTVVGLLWPVLVLKTVSRRRAAEVLREGGRA